MNQWGFSLRFASLEMRYTSGNRWISEVSHFASLRYASLEMRYTSGNRWISEVSQIWQVIKMPNRDFFERKKCENLWKNPRHITTCWMRFFRATKNLPLCTFPTLYFILKTQFYFFTSIWLFLAHFWKKIAYRSTLAGWLAGWAAGFWDLSNYSS